MVKKVMKSNEKRAVKTVVHGMLNKLIKVYAKIL